MYKEDDLQVERDADRLYELKFISYFTNYKFWYILSVICFLIIAYIYLTYSKSEFQVSTVLTLTNSESGEPAGEKETSAYIKELRSLSISQQGTTFSSDADNSMKGATIKNEYIRARPKDFDVSPGYEIGSIALSLTDSSINRATSYLSELLNLYIKKTHNAPANSRRLRQIDDSLRVMAYQLMALNVNTSNQQAVQPSKKLTDQKVLNPNRQESQRQTLALNVIQGYITKPVSSFVIIPDSYVPQKRELQNYIDQFNRLQVKKQSLLGDDDHEDAELKEILLKISNLQEQMNRYITDQKLLLSDVTPFGKTSLESDKPRTEINNTSKREKENRKSEILASINILQKRANEIQIPKHSSNEIVIRRSALNISAVQPQAPLIYCAAVLLGLIFPTVIIYLNGLISTRNLSNS